MIRLSNISEIMPVRRLLGALFIAFAFWGTGVGSLHAQYTIGGTVVGLAGSNLALANNGANELTINPSGSFSQSFTFAGTVSSGTAYNVVVSSPPSNLGQMCAVTNGSGTISSNVTNVVVSCFSISGTVSGLPAGQTLTLQINGAQSPSVTTPDGVFNFPAAAVSPATINYNITSPSWGSCSALFSLGFYASGTADTGSNNNIPNVGIICQPSNAPPPPPSHWTALKNVPNDSSGNLFFPETMLLLPDGSVLTNDWANQGQPQEWLRLVPDKTGSYVNGTWESVPNSICPHGLYASQVMTDGRVFIAGGEYPGPNSKLSGCTGAVDTEIYDPSVPSPASPWTSAKPPSSLIDPSSQPEIACPSGPNQAFLDMISETLPDGSVLMAPVCPKHCGDTLIFSPSKGWSPNAIPLANTGGKNPTGYSCSQQEDTWVKLQDGSILTADPPSPPAPAGSPQTPQTSERFFPSLNKWISQAPLGFALYDTEAGWSGGGETGPAFLLPNGHAVFLGGASVMGTYDPVANTWSQSTIAPNGPATGGAALAGPDVPGAMMANGKMLLTLRFAATAYNWEPFPVFFYEVAPVLNPLTNSYTYTFTEELGQAVPPNAPSIWTDCNSSNMLDLPDGTVLVESGCGAYQLYVYQSSGSPPPNGQPQIESISALSGACSTCYQLTGTGLNGISEGASYGDDAQMATDFPIVRVKDSFSNIAYARTYNWSSTSIAPSAPGSTDFQVPQGFQPCELQLVANGNPSPWTSFTHDCVLQPVFVPECNPQCALGSTVVWSLRVPLGDPWLDGTLLAIQTPGPEASLLAAHVQVSVDTQTLLLPESERWVMVELAGQGALRQRLSLIVGPTVELRDRDAGGQQADSLAPAGKLSIPYDSRGLSSQATIRIAKFDARGARWVETGPQTIDDSKHLITAGISGLGRFAVVADISPEH
jgi:hypothetical protein